MPVTGVTTDGHFVFDDTRDDLGRRVVNVANRILEDGTHYFAPVAVSVFVIGVTTDGHIVFNTGIDTSGRKVTDFSNRILQDGTTYKP